MKTKGPKNNPWKITASYIYGKYQLLYPNQEGLKYRNMKHAWFLYIRNRNYGSGCMLHIWVLGPFGIEASTVHPSGKDEAATGSYQRHGGLSKVKLANSGFWGPVQNK